MNCTILTCSIYVHCTSVMHKLIYNHIYAKVSVIIVILPCILKLYIRTEKCICSILVYIVSFLPRLHVPLSAVRWIRLQFSVRFFWHRLCLPAISWVFTFAFLFKLPGNSQNICTETLQKLHDNHENTMQSRFGFYDNREEHVRSRWGLYTACAIIQKGSHDFVLALCPLKSMSLSHVAHIASARCPCGHCAMQKPYVNGLWTYTFFNA